MGFASRLQNFFFLSLTELLTSFYGSIFWKGESFAATICLWPLLLLFLRVLLLFTKTILSNYLLLAAYFTVFFATYTIFYLVGSKLSRGFFGSIFLQVMIQVGSSIEDFVFRRKWCIWFFSLSLLLIPLLDVAGVLPAVLPWILRGVFGFYLAIRNLLLYEASKDFSVYKDEIPFFSEAASRYNCIDLEEGKELTFLLVVALFYLPFFVGFFEKPHSTPSSDPLKEESIPSLEIEDRHKYRMWKLLGTTFGLGARKLLSLSKKVWVWGG